MTEDEILETPKRRSVADLMKELAISGGVSGAALGLGTGMAFGKIKNLRNALKIGATGAGIGSAIAAGAGGTGAAVLGTPDDDEGNAYTKRGGIGGAIAGGLAGAGIGGLLASGKMAPKVFKAIMKSQGDNAIIKKIASMRGAKNAGIKGAGIGGAALGAVGSYQGADEGMQMDVVDRIRKDKYKKAMLEKRLARMRDELNGGSDDS